MGGAGSSSPLMPSGKRGVCGPPGASHSPSGPIQQWLEDGSANAFKRPAAVWLRARPFDAGNRRSREGGTIMNGDSVVQPYWSGGPFRMAIVHRPGRYRRMSWRSNLGAGRIPSGVPYDVLRVQRYRERSTRCVDQIPATLDETGRPLLRRSVFPDGNIGQRNPL